MREFESFFGEAVGRVADVDALDAQILALLLKDARMSARSIAKQLGRSPGAILERIARLEREEVIRGYSVFLDLARLGIGMTAIIGIEAEQDFALGEMVEKIQEVPECERVYVVTGTWDLLVQVRVRDQHHLSEVVFGKLWKLGGFRHSQTMLVLHRATTWDGYLPTLLEDLAREQGEHPPTLRNDTNPRPRRRARASNDGTADRAGRAATAGSKPARRAKTRNTPR